MGLHDDDLGGSMQPRALSRCKRVEGPPSGQFTATALNGPDDPSAEPVASGEAGCGLRDDCPRVCSIRSISFSSDATNSPIAQGAKFNCVFATATYLAQVAALESLEFKKCIRQRSGWADIQRVVSATAASAHAMIFKQLASVGLPRPPVEPQPPAGLVTLWCFTSDGGPEVKKFKRILKHMLKDHPMDIAVNTDCFLHADELQVQTGMKSADRWLAYNALGFKYFSTLAMAMHSWRDNQRPMYIICCFLYGAEWANEFALKKPPKPISQRWGRVEEVEKLLDEAGVGGVSIACPVAAPSPATQCPMAQRPVTQWPSGPGAQCTSVPVYQVYQCPSVPVYHCTLAPCPSVPVNPVDHGA